MSPLEVLALSDVDLTIVRAAAVQLAEAEREAQRRQNARRGGR